MNRTEVYKTPQFALTLIGLWLVFAGMAGLIYSVDPVVPNIPINSGTRLRVTPTSKEPTSTINQLQSAGGLQGQSSSSLQKPTQLDQLQPNAKQNSFFSN